MDDLSILASRRFGSSSPLRYPGGKAALAGFFADVIDRLSIRNVRYVEPYAGGAGAGVSLLTNGVIDELVINDIDPAVHAFWWSVLNRNAELTEWIREVPLTVEEWLKQRQIVREGNSAEVFRLGKAFFYLNRTNRSGIITGGIIGGLKQEGRYKLDARFNRDTLARRVSILGSLKDRIQLHDEDGRTVIHRYSTDERSLLYIDPPYVEAGSHLYLNAFERRDHIALSRSISQIERAHWVLTYDDSPFIFKLYEKQFKCRLKLNYSAARNGYVTELMVSSSSIGELIPTWTSLHADPPCPARTVKPG